MQQRSRGGLAVVVAPLLLAALGAACNGSPSSVSPGSGGGSGGNGAGGASGTDGGGADASDQFALAWQDDFDTLDLAAWRLQTAKPAR